MADPILSVKGLEVSIGGSRILRGVAFDVPRNGVLCLMGRNGVGKTTTLKAVVGLRETAGGRVALDGEDLGRFGPDARARRGIGYVPQGRDIFPTLTVAENLRIGQVARGAKAGEGFDEVFALFPVLREMLARKGGVLSGGQQQQLAIARALLAKPKVLILDEPTEGIQPNIIDQIGEVIRGLKGRMSILLVEQYLDFAKELADEFLILDRGTPVAGGPIAGLTDDVVKEHLVV
jgi:urea transport system ATP-binding protein